MNLINNPQKNVVSITLIDNAKLGNANEEMKEYINECDSYCEVVTCPLCKQETLAIPDLPDGIFEEQRFFCKEVFDIDNKNNNRYPRLKP